jgi:hypothetical protein
MSRNILHFISKLHTSMKDIKTISGANLSWIGIGTYGIGGRGHRDLALTEKKSDKVYLDALLHQFQTGYNFTEI